jgi:ankyrin repeat protein
VISHIQDRLDFLLDTEKPHFAAWLWVAYHSRSRHPEKPAGTPLHYMSDFGSPGLARYLVSKQPQYLLDIDENLGAPLHEAAAHANMEVFQILLEQCVDIDFRDLEDRTPLHRAAYLGRVEKCRILVERGADVNARDVNGKTPLHKVLVDLYRDAADRYFDVIQFLFSLGVDVDSQDKDGSTPLHIASYEECFKAVKILLEHGADARKQNNAGEAPIQVTPRSGKHEEDMIQLLSRHVQ